MNDGPGIPGYVPAEWAATLGYAALAKYIADLAVNVRAIGTPTRTELLTEAARRIGQVEQLAQAVLQLADDGGMPDSTWNTDERVQLACAALGVPEGGRHTHGRLWGRPGDAEEAGGA